MMNLPTLTRFPALLAIVPFVALAGGCGGGAGGSSASGAPGTQSGSDGKGPLGQDSALIADLVATDLVMSADASSGLLASATISNDGDAPASPDGWLLISTDPDFTTDFHYVPVTLDRDGEGGADLMPGESASYTLGSDILGRRIDVRLRRGGAHYARFWVNPDTSSRAVNPEGSLQTSHLVEEQDYANNLSPLAAFQSDDIASSCMPDPWEQNDSLEQATPLEMNIRYELTGCDENYDVMAIQMAAGESYEIREHRSGGVDAQWFFTLVDPQGSYLYRHQGGSRIVTAVMSGTYHLIASRQSSRRLAGDYALEIVPR